MYKWSQYTNNYGQQYFEQKEERINFRECLHSIQNKFKDAKNNFPNIGVVERKQPVGKTF